MIRVAVTAGIAVALAGCLFARQDARIRPGGQFGASTMIASTPDAETENPDADLRDLPEHNPAADVRGFTEITVGYGWRRVELRFHVPVVQWIAGDDFAFDASHVVIDPRLISLELYVQLVALGPWFAGLGLDSARGGFACATYELSPRVALTATTRALYVQTDNSGPDTRRSVLVQGQLALTYALDRKHDLRAFVSGITHAGSADPTEIRVQGSDYFDGGRSRVRADSMVLVGGSIDWH